MRPTNLTATELAQLSEQLYEACEKGNVAEIRALIERGADINRGRYDGKTPLLSASENGNIEVIKILIEAGVDVNKADSDGRTSLFVASQYGQTEAVKALIKAKADVNLPNEHGATPILLASENGHTEAVKLLIEAGADIDLANKNGATPLYVASANGHTEAIKLLIEAGVDVNLVNKYDETPLYLVSKYGYYEAIKILLAYGADLNQTSTLKKLKDLTALQIAVLSKDLSEDLTKQKEIIQTLFNYGADISVLNDEFFAKYLHQLYPWGEVAEYYEGPNEGQNIPVSLEIKQFIASLNNPEIIAKRDQELTDLNKERDANIARIAEFIAKKKAQEQALIEAINSANITEITRLVAQENVNVNFFNEAKQNPLLIALENKNLSEEDKQIVIQTLLSLKALPTRSLYLAAIEDKSELLAELLKVEGADIKMIYGSRDLIQIAVLNNSTKSIAKLLELGFDVNKKYDNGETLLCLASEKGHIKALKLLIEREAKVDLITNNGWTALVVASQYGHTEAIKALIEAKATVDLADNNDATPLYIACAYERTEAIKALIEAKATVDLAVNDGATPLYVASAYGRTEAIKLLIKAGADVNLADNNGATPLLIASENGHSKTIKILLLAGANFVKFESDSHLQNLIRALELITPEELAEIKQQPEKLKKIQESGVYSLLKIVNLQCSNSDTEEQRQNLEQQKQNFLRRIFIRELEPINFENSDSDQELEFRQDNDGQPIANSASELELEFLKLFPLISKILDSAKFSAENKLKIIEIIAEKPDDFKKQVHLIVNFPTLRKIDDDQSEALKLSLTELLPEEIKNLLIDRPNLLTLIDIILNQHPLQTQASLQSTADYMEIVEDSMIAEELPSQQSPSTMIEPLSKKQKLSEDSEFREQ